jgi:hypothetical protein
MKELIPIRIKDVKVVDGGDQGVRIVIGERVISIIKQNKIVFPDDEKTWEKLWDEADITIMNAGRNRTGLNMKIEVEKVKGTCLKGYLEAKFEDLCRVFGKPNHQPLGHKSDVEWIGEIDGQVFTIYNYKDGTRYLGREGLPVHEITEWHIGGRRTDETILEKVRMHFEKSKEESK